MVRGSAGKRIRWRRTEGARRLFLGVSPHVHGAQRKNEGGARHRARQWTPEEEESLTASLQEGDIETDAVSVCSGGERLCLWVRASKVASAAEGIRTGRGGASCSLLLLMMVLFLALREARETLVMLWALCERRYLLATVLTRALSRC